MAYTTWHSYLSGIPISDADLWNALAVLETELEEVYAAEGINYTYATFFTPGVTTVKAALNAIADYLATGGLSGISTAKSLTLYDDDDPLYSSYIYGQWIMPISGMFSYADAYVNTVPVTTACTIGIYLNGVLQETLTIPAGAHRPSTVLALSSFGYAARDIISIRTIAASSAGVLTVMVV